MTYILTFTNNTDSFSQNHQLEGIREALLNDCEIHRIDEEISFEKIDEAVEEAIENGCDNFMCLCENEDVNLLKEGLDSEYGRFFERIDVVEEEFHRFKEAEDPRVAHARSVGGDDVANRLAAKLNATNQPKTPAQPPKEKEPEELPQVNAKAVTMANIIMFNISYPFADILNQWLSSASSLQLPKPKVGDSKTLLCKCAALQGQHLKGVAAYELAQDIPGADFRQKFDNFENIFTKSESGSNPSTMVCANYTDQTKMLQVFEYCLKWGQINTINLYAPQGFMTVKTGPIKLKNGKTIQINVFPNLPTFNPSRNEPVYEALKELKEGRKNNYKGMKSRSEEAIKAELKDSAKGMKGQKEFDEAMKQLEKDPYSAEVETGWPQFINTLIDQTEVFDQEGDIRENLGEKQAEQYQSVIAGKIKAGIQAEAQAWVNFLDNAFPASRLIGFIKDLATDIKNLDKIAEKFKKDDKRKALEGLLRTDAYLTVRRAFSENLNDFNAENFQKNCMNYTANEEKCKAFIEAQKQAGGNLKKYEK